MYKYIVIFFTLAALDAAPNTSALPGEANGLTPDAYTAAIGGLTIGICIIASRRHDKRAN
ncbi:hypothetical protein [Pelagicoccus sp. SDUM812002]|uniref:hypothetical protein n=1 Tax=Pelagicoccus sp. SDUM812002 TaxID=3041266 RepID=UPI00280CE303|nr:hypothetical protein [Pelagicoccus sp. SDUM812002]MDQ8186017.1 hypothetical protein [Pelagicoccus sp. SDUM812002]